MLVDTSELRDARYAIAVRDRDGTLRAPTSREFTHVRYREKHPKARFDYVRFPVPDVATVWSPK